MGFRTERHFIAVNKVIIKEKLEMAFSSLLALFIHYTLAGIKSLLKIGGGGGGRVLVAREGVPETLEPSPTIPDKTT